MTKFLFGSFMILGLLIVQNQAAAQDVPVFEKRSSIFAEIGGNTFLYSINYDRIIYQEEKNKLTVRAGAGYWRYYDYYYNYYYSFYSMLQVPVEVNLLHGKEKHHLEAGLGLTYFAGEGEVLFTGYTRYMGTFGYWDLAEIDTISPDISPLIFTLRTGYRYQRPQGRWMWRGALVFWYCGNRHYWRTGVMPGISGGYSF